MIEPIFHKLRLLLVTAVLMLCSFGGGFAFANSEQPGEINLDNYLPDQSMWSEKAKGKYESAKITSDTPLALLKIKRLNIEAPVYYGTDRVTLDRGLGIVEGTTNIGEVGNIGLSGHRDSFFRPLKDIKLGDIIEMSTLERVQEFEVSNISIVDALDISVLDPSETTVLTLITCHPFYYEGYAPDRYIVRATPVSRMNKGEPDTVQKAR